MTENNDLKLQIDALLGRVDELESRAALRDLVSDYCLGFDNHDWDRFISIWHDDAIWEIGPPFGTFIGHEDIREAVVEVLYPVWRETHHLTSNLRLSFSDADHAHGVCNVDCIQWRFFLRARGVFVSEPPPTPPPRPHLTIIWLTPSPPSL